MKQKFSVFIWIAIAIIAFTSGVWLQNQQQSNDTSANRASTSSNVTQHEVITWLPPGRQLSAVPVKNQHNESVMFPAENKLWKIVFFGFTHCPDICPTTLSQLDRLQQSLAPSLRDQLNLIFVTVDPERDSTDRMKNYLQSFDNTITGLRADNAQLEILSRQLGVAFHRVELGADNYSMDHSASLYFVSPDGQWSGIATAPHDWDELRKAISGHLSG